MGGSNRLKYPKEIRSKESNYAGKMYMLRRSNTGGASDLYGMRALWQTAIEGMATCAPDSAHDAKRD